jgi:hypothetical protein
MDEGSFAQNETLLSVILTWERFHPGPSDFYGQTMSDPVSVRGENRAVSKMTGNGVGENEGEGPGWRGVW